MVEPLNVEQGLMASTMAAREERYSVLASSTIRPMLTRSKPRSEQRNTREASSTTMSSTFEPCDTGVAQATCSHT